MRVICLLCFLLMLGKGSLQAQDTLNFQRNYNGTSSFWLITKGDTNLVSTYPNHKKATQQQLKNHVETGKFFRWYENGKLMCELQKINGLAEGKAIYYDKSGNKLAEFFFEKDSIKNSVFHNKELHFIFGKVDYSSKVYGGMQREDGSSNISENSGDFKQLKIKVYRVDSLKAPVLVSEVFTDLKGEFFLSAPKGNLGFFPEISSKKNILPGQFCPIEEPHPSGNASWSLPCPLKVGNEKLIRVKLHYSSVGYAP